MSKSENNDRKSDGSSKTIKKLEQTVLRLERKERENDYIVSNLKAEIRLLRDTLGSLGKSINNALEIDDVMFESLNSNIERGTYLNDNVEEMYYPGELK